MTDYVILRHDPGVGWEMETATSDGTIVPVKASSASRAISAANVGEGKYVAVPVRNWKPLTVKTEQVTKVTIG